METTITIGKSLPRPLCKSWKRVRPCTRGTQINNNMPPCIEGAADGKVRDVKLG